MAGLKRFTAVNEAIAHAWSAEPVSVDDWTVISEIATGESKPQHVQNRDGVRGIAKAAVDGQGTPRAAHERIASALAAEIGFPVPPVALWREPSTNVGYAISLRAFKQPLTWHEAYLARVINPAFLSAAEAVLAAGYVFHTWIGDVDHDDHRMNLLVDGECDASAPSLAFIDHAFSMSRTWTVETPPLRKPPAYYVKPSLLRATDLSESVARIEAVTSDTIQRIVNEVPRDFLPEDKAELIAKGLNFSRDALRASFC